MINDNLNGKGWSYHHGKFKTEQPVPPSGNDKWVVMKITLNNR